MEQQAIGIAHVNASSFSKATQRVREGLSRQGLTVVAERRCPPLSHTLYVACPILLLEILAVDPAAAVFLPAHIVLDSRPDGAEARWLTAAALPPSRLPVGMLRPVYALHAKIDSAFRCIQEPDRPFLFRKTRGQSRG